MKQQNKQVHQDDDDNDSNNSNNDNNNNNDDDDDDDNNNDNNDNDDIGDNVTFESLGLPQPLVEAIKDIGWLKPTEIQLQAIPEAMTGRDIIGLAETGSGKTGAFAIPIISSLLENPQ
jgi:ATP-dependent RNA helicase DDX47/RRP3